MNSSPLSPDPVSAIEERARTSPSSAAVSWLGGSWSYRSLWDRVRGRGRRIALEGIADGDLVSTAYRAGPEYLADLLAIWWARAAVVPLHPRNTEAERRHAEQLFRPAFHIDVHGEVIRRRGANKALTFAPESGIAAGIRTSGSSGAPRGVVLGHSGFRAVAGASQQRLGLLPADRWGLVLSTAHVGGLATVARATLLGASLRIFPTFDPAALIKAMLEGEVTHVSLVPAMLDALLDQGLVKPPDTFRCALIGGARTRPRLLQRARDAQVPVALTWGLTETTSQVTTAPPEVVQRTPGTVGVPLYSLEVNTDAEGRLGVRGPTLARGVIQSPGKEPIPLPLEEGGWFRTQDRGRIDKDGLVWIEGRADQVIVSGGVNVDVHEVEGVLLGAVGVKDAAVYGMPDEKWGQIVVGAVVMDVERTSTPGELIAHCGARLTRAKCPSHIVMVPELPRTPSGKVAYSRLPGLLEPIKKSP